MERPEIGGLFWKFSEGRGGAKEDELAGVGVAEDLRVVRLV